MFRRNGAYWKHVLRISWGFYFRWLCFLFLGEDFSFFLYALFPRIKEYLFYVTNKQIHVRYVLSYVTIHRRVSVASATISRVSYTNTMYKYHEVSNQQDTTNFTLLIFLIQPYIFQATNSPILRSCFWLYIQLLVQCCRLVSRLRWTSMEVPSQPWHRSAAVSVHYTKSCIYTVKNAPEDGRICRLKHVGLN